MSDTALTPQRRAELIAHGFAPTRFPEQDGEFLLANITLGAMPDASGRLIDDFVFYDDTPVIVEILPDATIRLFVPDADYIEDPDPLESEAGLLLLADTVAAIQARG